MIRPGDLIDRAIVHPYVERPSDAPFRGGNPCGPTDPGHHGTVPPSDESEPADIDPTDPVFVEDREGER